MEYVSRKNTHSFKWDELHRDHTKDDLLPVWIADMDFAPPRHVVELLQEYVRNPLGYFRTPDDYFHNFIAWEKEYHRYDVKKEWICYAPGVVPAIHWVLHLFTSPQAPVLVATPAYPNFLQTIRDTGRRVVSTAMIRNREGRFEMNFADFERKIVEQNVEAFILCNPHNPTGTLWSEEELKRLLDICKKHRVYILADEIHQDFVNPAVGRKKITAATLGDYSEWIFTFTSGSKSFNLGGVQNAFAIIENEENRRKYEEYARYIGVSDGNGLGYLATMASFTAEGRKWLEEVCAQIYSNNELFRKELSSLEKLRFSKLESTYLLWVDLSAYFDTEEELSAFCEEKCGFAPSYGLAFGGEEYRSCLRINLATSSANIAEVARRIRENIK